MELLPEGAATGFGRGAARLYFRFARSRARILRENLTRAFPEKSAAEVRRLARAGRDSQETMRATLVVLDGAQVVTLMQQAGLRG